MKLEFEYGQGLMSAELPDSMDVFIPGQTVADPSCIEQSWEALYLSLIHISASLGGSVFVHGIKNQLLANRVLCKRLAEQLDADQPDLEALRSYAQQLLENNAGLISHVEELYKSFKSNALSMRRCSLTEMCIRDRYSV